MKAPHMAVAVGNSSASPLASIMRKPPHMAILAEVMAPVVTTTSLLCTIPGPDVIRITTNNVCIVREAIRGRPHRMTVVEPVTPLTIGMWGRAPIVPPVVVMIVKALLVETMDPTRKTLMARPADMAMKVAAQPAEAMDRMDKSLTAPPLDVVIMVKVRLVLMGALRRLHMVGVVVLGLAGLATNHHLSSPLLGKYLLLW